MVSAEEARQVTIRSAKKQEEKLAKRGILSYMDKIYLHFIEKGIIRASIKGNRSYAAFAMSPAVKSILKKNGYKVSYENALHFIYW